MASPLPDAIKHAWHGMHTLRAQPQHKSTAPPLAAPMGVVRRAGSPTVRPHAAVPPSPQSGRALSHGALVGWGDDHVEDGLRLRVDAQCASRAVVERGDLHCQLMLPRPLHQAHPQKRRLP